MNATFRTTLDKNSFRNILNTLNFPSPSRNDTSTSDSSSESILKDCKTSKRAQIKNMKKTAKDEDFKNKVCKENFPRPGQQRNVTEKIASTSHA